MAGLRLQASVVAAKLEGTEGTAETLTNTEGFLAFNAQVDPTIDMHERDPHRETLSPMISLAGRQSCKITFQTELIGAAAAGTAPYWGVLAKACGMSETLVAVTSATYKPATASIPSITLAVYRDGKRKLITGARGNLKIDFEVGKPAIMTWEFTGASYADTDVALLTPTYPTIAPPTLLSATFTLDSYAANFSKIGIDLGNTVALRTDPSKASGHISALITGRKPKLTIDPEAVVVATKNWLTGWTTDAGVAMSLAMTQRAAGNKFTITAPAVRIEDLKEGNRTGLLTDEITAVLGLSTGDDELSIAIT